MKRFDTTTLALLVFLLPAIANADVIWPALYVEQGILTWWVIAIGLLVEWPLFKLATSGTWKRSASSTLLANLASTLLGIALIPAAGLGWELSAGQIVNQALHVGTFNPVTWGASFALAVAVNTCVEAFVLARRGTPLKRSWRWLVVANVLSIGLAVVSVYFRRV